MKISVIGHTHRLRTVDDLPPRAKLALTESDLLLHVGNVGNFHVFRALEALSGLIFGVCGPQDPGDVKRFLQEKTVVKFAGRRIGLIFNGESTELSLKNVLKRSPPSPDALANRLITEFGDIDCVLFGSPNKPFNYLHRGLLVFNPGPLLREDGSPGSMGLLEITDRVISGRIVNL
jgi:predicted phosphodiesterase